MTVHRGHLAGLQGEVPDPLQVVLDHDVGADVAVHLALVAGHRVGAGPDCATVTLRTFAVLTTRVPKVLTCDTLDRTSGLLEHWVVRRLSIVLVKRLR